MNPSAIDPSWTASCGRLETPTFPRNTCRSAADDAVRLMARDDWFRSSDWDAEAKADFETRLARGKSDMRGQSRRIKAIALLESKDAAKVAAGRDMLVAIARNG